MSDKLKALNLEYTQLCAVLGEKTLFIKLLEKESKDLLDRIRNIKRQADKLMADQPSEIKLPEPEVEISSSEEASE